MSRPLIPSNLQATEHQKHLQRAGARLVRTGGYSLEQVREWGREEGLAKKDIRHLVIGAQRELTPNKQR